MAYDEKITPAKKLKAAGQKCLLGALPTLLLLPAALLGAKLANPPYRLIEPLPTPALVDVKPFMDDFQLPCSFSDKGYKIVNLDEVVKTTLAQQRGIAIADADTQIAVGLAWEAAGPFDTQVNALLERTDPFDLQNTSQALKSNLFGWFNEADLTVNKTTRAGTQALLAMNVEQQKNDLNGPPPYNRNNVANVSFQIIQPLLRDFLYGQAAMNERALWLLAQGARLDALQVTANSVLDSITTYWDAVSAKGQIRVLEEYIERLKPLVENVQRLAEENLYAANDVNQPLAQLSTERARLDAARQEYYAAIRLLKIRMGVDVNIDMLNFALCEEHLTTIDHFLAKAVNPCNYPSAARALVENAWQYRFDLAAAAARERAAIVALYGAQNAMLPALNLFGGVTLTDSFVGEKSRPLFAGMRFSKPQRDINFGLTFSYPLENSAASGRAYQRSAEVLRTRLVREQLQQDIAAEVLTVWNDYIQLLGRWSNTDKAIDRYQALAVNERKKLKEGFSTLFELIDFENRLTDEQLSKVLILNDIAKTIARLYSLTGLLISPNGMRDCLEVADTTAFPSRLLEPPLARKMLP